MTPTYIQSAFGLQSIALAGKIAGIAGYLGECHFHAVRAVNAMRNPFVTTVFANRYADEAGEQGFPLYLQDNGQAALRRSGSTDRLHLHVGNILEVMTQVATSKATPLARVLLSSPCFQGLHAEWRTTTTSRLQRKT